MNRNISIRELALLGVLIILAAYYFVVQGPVAKDTEELTQNRTTLQSQIDEGNIKLAAMQEMQSELDEIYDEADGNPQALADYSNNKVLLNELNTILNMADKFDVSFGAVSFNDNIMRREISISFETQSKDAAEFIAEAIESSPNAYLITGFSSSCNDSSGVWSSTMSLVNYEFVTDAQAEALGLVDGSSPEQETGSATQALLDTLTNGTD